MFFIKFYTGLTQELLKVTTDCLHLAGFKLQCKILQQLVVVANDHLQSPINGADGQPHKFGSNKEYVVELFKTTIISLFPNLNQVLVETLAIKLFNSADNWKEFKGTVRDLMVSMRSFSSTQNEFYEHERKVSVLSLI